MNHKEFKERLEEIQRDSVGIDFCGAKECRNYQLFLTTNQSLITLFEDYTKAIVGDNDYEEGMKGDDKMLTQHADYIRQTIIKSSKTILKGESDEI